MSQNDFVIADQLFPATRTDINSALQALASCSKGAAAPATPYAGQFWLEDDNPSATEWTLWQYDGTDWVATHFFNITTNIITPALKGQRWQSFVVIINNDSGTLKVQTINSFAGGSVLPTFSDRITGASVTATAVATGTDGSTAFTAGYKIGSAQTHQLHVNTAAQLAVDMCASATIAGNTTATAGILCEVIPRNIDINGTTRLRPALTFTSPAGNHALTTGNIGSGTSIAVRVQGYFA